jgi:tetratricopeptide (TPR) repeat protein
MRTALGDVLVLRGRLGEADSVYRVAAAGRGVEERGARVGLAELLARRGDRAGAARHASALIAERERGPSGWSARDEVALGRAYLLVSSGDPDAVRSALRAFDSASAQDPALIDGALRASDLFLEKFVAPEARKGYEGVLAVQKGNARATLGLARVMEFTGDGDALGTARAALKANPSLVPAELFIARLHLEAERGDSATAAARRALAVDPSAMDAWATIGAVAWLSGDSASWRRARTEAERLSTSPSTFYVTLADAASRQRRYADAARFSAQALALDPLSVPALGALGTNELRAGEMAKGRAQIERAFAIDPFNLWHKNTLDLLDVLDSFPVVDQGRFRFVAPRKEEGVLLPYLAPLLDEAYGKLAARYDYRPPAPIRLEIFDRHADFSVRTVGLTGLGALGVSFGRVLAMDAPSARGPGDFNWGSTAWHELTHTFTLGLSDNRVPRWFSEGVSVLEERRARPGWGAQATPQYVAALKAKALRPVSALNEGFVRPRNPQEVILSYYHASLVAEMIETEFGPAALPAMLRGWRDGLATPAVVQRVLRIDEPTLDTRFDAWVQARFRAREVTEQPEGDAALEPLMREVAARERAGDDAGLIAALERVIWVWPYEPGVHVKLAEAAARSGDPARALRERRVILALGPSDVLAARVELARAMLGAGDRAGARREVLSVLEQAPTYEKAQVLLLELRQATPDGGGR